jgi:ubiquinone/menaquinone biosynthesis C-methylase UbiE
MISESPYDNLATIYDKWIIGDNTSRLVLDFYLKLTSQLDIILELVELGIGTGRISIEISKQQGRNIIGIDCSSNMLAECQKNIVQNNLEKQIRLIKMDIRKFSLPYKAKFIMLPYRTIGHFLTIADKKLLIENVYNNLDNDGVFVLDHYIFDKNWATQNNNTFIKMYTDENIILYDKLTFNYEKQILTCNVYQESKNITRKKVSFKYSWIEPCQMKDLLKEAGFKIIEVYGDFNFNKLNTDSEQQIWIVEK